MPYLKLSSTLLLIATCFLFKTVVPTKRVTTCESPGNVHFLKCDSGVISVQGGVYGRTDPEICGEGRPPQQLADTECSQEGAVDILKMRCNGKKRCELNIDVFRTSDPCPGIFKYLETNFTCVPPKFFHVLACEDSLAHLSCEEEQVIVVKNAIYGRTDQRTCIFERPPSQVQNDECKGKVKSTVANSCNGEKSCTIRANNANFGDPCGGTYKYLKIIYTCEFASPVQRATTCDSLGNVHRLKCASGVISVREGLYGRTDPEICSEGRPPQQLADTECSQEGAVDVLKTRCNGKKRCELNVDVFRTSDPCPGIFKYLDTNFTCLPPKTFHVLACEDSLAHLSCEEGYVIGVHGAIFGRSDQTTCIFERPPSQVQNDECRGDVKSIVANSCNGEKSCTIRASNGIFGDPCGGTYKYLRVTYVCKHSWN
uniref:rhamnose-binding lectin-like isoform X2 n=1 Tax=Doryrhamphus excisus TaxID=161450 RepID=UPI0025AEA56F|nr:rhamnose-binding lectin-like isoform X2 [Doryrhamphus excisus]